MSAHPGIGHRANFCSCGSASGQHTIVAYRLYGEGPSALRCGRRQRYRFRSHWLSNRSANAPAKRCNSFEMRNVLKFTTGWRTQS